MQSLWTAIIKKNQEGDKLALRKILRRKIHDGASAGDMRRFLYCVGCVKPGCRSCHDRPTKKAKNKCKGRKKHQNNIISV